MWRAARRLREHQDQDCIILHLGDHDPSGIDMSRDIQNRLTKFGAAVDVRRIALTIEQVKKYNPPPNPVKLTDTRKDVYINKHGTESWELDALSPDVIAKLITKNISVLTDLKKLNSRKELQEEQREKLYEIADSNSTQ